MSEIRVTTLKDTSGGNSSTTAQIASGRAKAWVNFNGVSTVAIRANFNVNSITDNGTGHFTINFTSALSDANYCYSFGGQRDTNITIGGNCVYSANPEVVTTTTALRISCTNDGGSLVDALHNNVIVHR